LQNIFFPQKYTQELLPLPVLLEKTTLLDVAEWEREVHFLCLLQRCRHQWGGVLREKIINIFLS
jgi:hypothetical protein